MERNQGSLSTVSLLRDATARLASPPPSGESELAPRYRGGGGVAQNWMVRTASIGFPRQPQRTPPPPTSVRRWRYRTTPRAGRAASFTANERQLARAVGAEARRSPQTERPVTDRPRSERP